MFEASFLPTGGICEFRDENLQIDEGGASALVSFRVLDATRWKTIVGSMLSETKKFSDTFGLTVRKEFFLADTDVRFTWAVYIWSTDQDGLEDAVEALKPYLGALKAVVPVGKAKPPAAMHSIPPVVAQTRPQLVQKTKYGNGEEMGVIPLPHRGSKDRNTAPAGQRTVQLAGGEVFDPTKKPRVHVSGLTSHGGGAAVGDQEL